MKFNKIHILLLCLISIAICSHHQDEVDLEDSSERNDNFLNFLMKPTNLKIGNDEPDMCLKRPNFLEPNFYYFLPVFKARLYKAGDSNAFTSGCFKTMKATLLELSLEKTVIELEASNAKKATCSDLLIIHTTNINHLTSVFYKGKHQIVLKNLSEDDLDEIRVNGLKILGFCQGFLASIRSFFMTLEMYLGGLGYNPEAPIPIFRPHIPENMIEANVKNVQFYNNYTMRKRKNVLIDLDESQIHTGDVLMMRRLDGVDTLVMMGTGSHVAHSVVACWIDGELYVLESQDGWYWPVHGIQRNKWKDWIKYARNAEFEVALLPLKPELREKFNTEAAIKWFTSGIEGLPYGYHVFLLSWIDTVDSNAPFSLSHTHFEFIFSIIEKISRKISDLMLGEALNMRLGTRGMTFPQLTAEAARRGKTFEQLMAEPEKDGWIYSTGLNIVCSGFVTAFFRAGGLFNDIPINANEFTPRDVYQLNFFDLNYQRPQICIDADPELPYCQLMGDHVVELPGYSTLEPYAYMNERCPTIGPDFYRPSDC